VMEEEDFRQQNRGSSNDLTSDLRDELNSLQPTRSSAPAASSDDDEDDALAYFARLAEE